MRRLVLLLASLAALPAVQAGKVDPPVEAGGTYSVPVTSMKELRFRGTTRQQYDFSCGSAALATLLTSHYGFPVSEEDVFKEMYARGDKDKIRREGFSPLVAAEETVKEP
jgi:predicted double-glycine peptidase